MTFLARLRYYSTRHSPIWLGVPWIGYLLYLFTVAMQGYQIIPPLWILPFNLGFFVLLVIVPTVVEQPT